MTSRTFLNSAALGRADEHQEQSRSLPSVWSAGPGGGREGNDTRPARTPGPEAPLGTSAAPKTRKSEARVPAMPDDVRAAQLARLPGRRDFEAQRGDRRRRQVPVKHGSNHGRVETPLPGAPAELGPTGAVVRSRASRSGLRGSGPVPAPSSGPHPGPAVGTPLLPALLRGSDPLLVSQGRVRTSPQGAPRGPALTR